jgi:uncharacterized membrane protein YeiB
LLGWFANILFIVALPTLSLGYATGLAVLIQNEAWKHRLRPFAAVGRMALTNYLLQSILCTLFFYHYTTGLYGKVGPAWGLIPTVVLYGLQVPFSNWVAEPLSLRTHGMDLARNDVRKTSDATARAGDGGGSGDWIT